MVMIVITFFFDHESNACFAMIWSTLKTLDRNKVFLKVVLG
jgi:hypothetical protein